MTEHVRTSGAGWRPKRSVKMPDRPNDPIDLPWPDWVTLVLLVLLAPAGAMLCWAVTMYITGGGF